MVTPVVAAVQQLIGMLVVAQPKNERQIRLFLRYAARLAALGNRSQLNRVFILVESLGLDLERVIVEWCKVLYGELQVAPGEDLALAIIATQDFACLLKIEEARLSLATRQAIQALVDETEDVKLDTEAVATLEDFLEQFPIPEEYRLGIVDSPLSEFEVMLLERVRAFARRKMNQKEHGDS